MVRAEQKNMWIGRPTWERLTRLKASMEQAKGPGVRHRIARLYVDSLRLLADLRRLHGGAP